jgi:hypothetical protein
MNQIVLVTRETSGVVFACALAHAPCHVPTELGLAGIGVGMTTIHAVMTATQHRGGGTAAGNWT